VAIIAAPAAAPRDLVTGYCAGHVARVTKMMCY